MDESKWTRAREIFGAALERPAEERERYVAAACEGDEELQELLDSLLEWHLADSHFLEEELQQWRLAAGTVDAGEEGQDLEGKPRHIAHYQVLSRLGYGGMGVVYRALDTRLQRIVALKLLRSELTTSLASRQRLLREARAASRLTHQNICTVHELGETDDGQTFIVMALHEGETLESRLSRRPLPLKEALRVATQIGRGLAAAHAHGMVHRDIKPGNILLANDGEAKILDFGIAVSDLETRLTQPDARSPGTPAYMSPEHVRGEAIDRRSDLWSLGAILFEMLTGRSAPRGDPTGRQGRMLTLEDTSTLPEGVEAPLDRVLRTALADDPDARYQRAEDLLRDLRSLSASLDQHPGMGLGRAARPVYRSPWGWIGMLMLLALLAVTIWPGFGPWGADLQPTFAVRSLAVLPFENLQGEQQQEYFVDGMTGALITELSRLRDCAIISRASVMQYRRTVKAAPAIARELGVDALVAGTVLREGNRVGISAELIEGASGRVLWADRYQRELRDVLVLQGQLASAIAAEIGGLVQTEGAGEGQNKMAVVPAAYDLYLKGQSFVRRRTERDLLSAADYFRQAIEIDPSHAESYAGLAEAYFMLAFYGHRPGRDAYPRSMLNARKALALDPELAAAHSILGVGEAFNDGDWRTAEQRLLRSVQLSPSYAEGHSFYGGLVLSSLGRGAEAILSMEQAQRLDPLSPVIFAASGFVYWWAGDDAQAEAAARQALELAADFWLGHALLGLLYEQDGRYTEAVEELRTANDLSRRSLLTLGMLGYVYGRAGLREQALAILDEMNAAATRHFVSPFDVALVHAGLGDADSTFAWLERAYEERSGWLGQLGVDPRFEVLRADPRFQGLLARMGLAARRAPANPVLEDEGREAR